MIGITGVTGKLGSYVADLVDQQGISSIHLARSPERAKVYASAEIRRMSYTNTPKVVEALKGIDGFCSGKSRACQGAQGVFRCCKACGGEAYRLYLLLWGR